MRRQICRSNDQISWAQKFKGKKSNLTGYKWSEFTGSAFSSLNYPDIIFYKWYSTSRLLHMLELRTNKNHNFADSKTKNSISESNKIRVYLWYAFSLNSHLALMNSIFIVWGEKFKEILAKMSQYDLSLGSQTHTKPNTRMKHMRHDNGGDEARKLASSSQTSQQKL